jgi:hypothetical protein
LVASSADEVWFLTDSHPLRHYRLTNNAWDAVPGLNGGDALAFDSDQLFFGEFWENRNGSTTNRLLGLSVLSPPFSVRREIAGADGLPQRMVSTLTVDGRNLWVGGMGYIAVMDRAQNRVRKITYVRARSVDQIEIGGGYIWAKYDRHLHRASLSDLE